MSQLTINAIALVIAFVIIEAGELLPNQVRPEYEENYDWVKVVRLSRAIGFLSGIVTILGVNFLNTPSELNPQFTVIASYMAGYITTQSFMTDLKILKINRQVLRVGYITLGVLAIINVKYVPELSIYKAGVYQFMVLLFVLFLFSSIGASDVRAAAVGLPYAVSLGGTSAVLMLITSILIAALVLFIKRERIVATKMPAMKEKYPEELNTLGNVKFYLVARKIMKQEMDTNKKYAMAVGPYMIAPFAIYFALYPVLLTIL